MSLIPSVPRRRSTTSEGVGVSVERTISAVFDTASGPTAIELIEIFASPRAIPTRPITPGRSSLFTTSMDAAGGISTLCLSTLTMRVSRRVPIVISVPDTVWSPDLTVIRFTYSGDSTFDDSLKVSPCSAASCGALTNETPSWPVATSSPFKAQRVRIFVPEPASSPW